MSGKPVVGSMSSRVMNMKFMRFAKNRESLENSQINVLSSSESMNGISSSNTDNAENTKNFHDSSEWSLIDNNKNINDSNKSNTGALRNIKLNIKRRNMLKVRNGNQSTVGVTILQRNNLSIKGKTLFSEESTRSSKNSDISTKKRKLYDKGKVVRNNNNDDDNDVAKKEEEDGYDIDKIFKDTMKKSKRSNKNKKNKKQRRN
ncbi:Mpp6p PWA37_000507 [Arxiozyma heterogenica]|uniref:Mpp6p n=1 Tax=Arxiozyma heterogenica TaxID=278026 RepID=UPI002EE27BE8